MGTAHRRLIMSDTPRINADPQELSKFAALAARWWDPTGEMKPLHQMNPLRLRYIEERSGGLAGRQVLDVGCGGGTLTEAMARSGARATGIDLAEESLRVAEEHARDSGAQVQYRCIGTEQLSAEKPASFDVVTCMEMLEHVPDPSSIVASCARLVPTGGHVFFSTINRNPKAYALAILAAEHLLRLLPAGTHDYAKFIRPSELEAWCRHAGLEVLDITGIHYNPLFQRFRLGGDVDVNYLVHCQRTA
jgi:2-polyprenyl-6-hydroxyphenyl methylase/3-demethylubiquinone-9 3-methyltransferase